MSKSLVGVIAVVDDDYRVLESIEELLESAGHDVRLFASAKALLSETRLSEIDCLISDVSMPHMDGLALQRLLRDARPELPVILITGRHEIVNQENQSGMPLLQKPFDGKSLLAAVASELRLSQRKK